MKFNSNEAFEIWLRAQNQEVCVAIATRVALRVWPLVTGKRFWKDDETAQKSQKRLVLLTGRAMMITGVAGAMSTPFARAAADAAFDATAHARARAAARARTVYDAAAAARAVARSASAAGAVFDAAARARAAFDDATAARADAGRPVSEMLACPLWPDGPPEGLRLEDIGQTLLDTDPDFGFFKRWYDGMYTGQNQIAVGLLERVVTQITPDTWQKADPPEIARQIATIEAEYLLEQAPTAEKIEFNEETKKFRVVPAPIENEGFISALLSRTTDALDDALLGGNGLREDMREVRVLRRVHDRYGNDPQRIEMDYTSVAVSLRRQLNETKELEDCEDNLALLEAVEEGARGIRANHPEIAANRESLAKQKMRELPKADIELLEDALDVLPEISEDVLAEDYRIDIPQLINDATLPVPSGAPPLPGADEATRIFTRVSRTKLLYDKICDNGASAFDSKGFKTVRLGLTLSPFLYALVQLGIRLFGVL